MTNRIRTLDVRQLEATLALPRGSLDTIAGDLPLTRLHGEGYRFNAQEVRECLETRGFLPRGGAHAG